MGYIDFDISQDLQTCQHTIHSQELSTWQVGNTLKKIKKYKMKNVFVKYGTIYRGQKLEIHFFKIKICYLFVYELKRKIKRERERDKVGGRFPYPKKKKHRARRSI